MPEGDKEAYHQDICHREDDSASSEFGPAESSHTARMAAKFNAPIATVAINQAISNPRCVHRDTKLVVVRED